MSAQPPGWACACHTAGRSVPTLWCPQRYAVAGAIRRGPAIGSAAEIASRPPIIRSNNASPEAPGWIPRPRGVETLAERLRTAGHATRLTYSLSWTARKVKIDAPPPDADRDDEDARDFETVRVSGENAERQKGRKTRDVAVLRESLALRSKGFGVAVWVRTQKADGTWDGWKADAAWLLNSGRWRRVDMTAFKKEIGNL